MFKTQAMLIVTRCFLSLLFVTTAIGKLLDNRGFAQVIASYELGIREDLLLPLALTISLLELLIGLNILRDRQLGLNVAGTLCFHIGYTALAVTTLLRGIAIGNCGCFGVFLARPLRWSTVLEDATLIVVSSWCLVLLRAQRQQAAPGGRGGTFR